jgi:hypothetical protein
VFLFTARDRSLRFLRAFWRTAGADRSPLVVAPLLCVALALAVGCDRSRGHERRRNRDRPATAVAQVDTKALAETAELPGADVECCQLTVDLIDEFSKQSVPGMVRITEVGSGKAIKLPGGFHRALNWYSLPEKTTVRVPCTKVRVEALRGLETVRAEHELDLTSTKTKTAEITLSTFYDSRFRQWYSGNTHLHLMKMTRAEADRYLKVVPRSDSLDLVFLSYLRRNPDEKDYISNEIVAGSLTGEDLKRLSGDGLLLVSGEERRHNFGRGGEGYGHVMLLDVKELIRPVSLGPGIMGSGTDGVPLQGGIEQARAAEATVIWCHNSFGLEDVPSWAGGLLHAQNIFDGGSQGSYEDTFYRYLNLGLRIPFSTGTDWFIYDFARVYVPVFEEFTAANWLAGLREGKSYITNGPLLELETERAAIGGEITMFGPNRITVVGRGMGRLNFGGLELVHNGRVVRSVRAEAEGGYYLADVRHSLEVHGPGWFALRIPPNVGTTELGRPLFAHTSPIYLKMQGRGNIFDADTARELVEELRASIETIQEKAVFADDGERDKVLGVYRTAIESLEARIRSPRRRTRISQ